MFISGFARRGICTTSCSSNFKSEPNFPVATNYETFEYDVLVIGAGGAGLRAAIEASAAGVKVGLICKSLLGKAHTVMAEGGMAAAMGNVDDRDNWRVHFADTMRGGQYVNNWRMAELHAKEAPARVHELEAWGAVFDRTKDGKILQRNFGGHRYPRLAHVGDRTGLELIRTLAGPRHSSGHYGPHGAHGGFAAQGRRPRGRRVRLRPRARAFSKFSRPRRWCWRRAVWAARTHHQQFLGRHGRRRFAGVSRRRGIAGHGVHPVSSDGHDLAAERHGPARDRGRARRRRRVAQQGRQALHVRRHSGQLQIADLDRSRKKAGATRRATKMPSARRNC